MEKEFNKPSGQRTSVESYPHFDQFIKEKEKKWDASWTTLFSSKCHVCGRVVSYEGEFWLKSNERISYRLKERIQGGCFKCYLKN